MSRTKSKQYRKQHLRAKKHRGKDAKKCPLCGGELERTKRGEYCIYCDYENPPRETTVK